MANLLTSVQNSGTNNFLNPLKSVNKLASAMFTPGIVGGFTNTSGIAPMTGAYAVNAQGSPNMTVAVTAGDLVVNATPTGDVAQNFIVNMDVAQNVTISSNSTGSTKYDFIYMQLDATKLVNPAVNGLDAASIITQRSNTASVDSNGTPSNSLLLAEVAVANGAVSITNSNITDHRFRATVHTDGWNSANETWAYASATTITVPSGALGKYQVGDKVKLFQAGSWKYFYIVAVADTLLTITGGSDYTLTNTTISHPLFSHAATPVGFPGWFNYTPVWTGFSANPVVVARFSINGRLCSVNVVRTANGTSNATSLTMSLPVNVANIGSNYYSAYGEGLDNGVVSTIPVHGRLSAGTNTATMYKDWSTAGWTASGTKGVDVVANYEI